jgi:6-phosphogluconolactonase
MLLGMGDDGHTASLFPHTEALKENRRLVVANYVPSLKSWRMTLTFPCINQSRQICVYVAGASKKTILNQVLNNAPSCDLYPIQCVGTPDNPSLWITDISL